MSQIAKLSQEQERDQEEWEKARAKEEAQEEKERQALEAMFHPMADDDPQPLLSSPPRRQKLLETREGATFFPLGKVGMLVGPGGTGKTQALVQLALSVATGYNWLDTYRAHKEPGGVLLALGEEDQEEVWRRMYHTAEVLGLSDDDRRGAMKNIVVLPLDGRKTHFLGAKRGLEYAENWKRKAFYDWLLTLVEAESKIPSGGWRLIAIDPASRFMGPDGETDNATATEFVRLLARFSKAPGGPAVIFAHHSHKGALSGTTDQGAARGSSALTDGVRWQANLEFVLASTATKEKAILSDRANLRVVKNNYGPRPGKALALRRENWGVLVPMTQAEIKAEKEAMGEADKARRRKRKEAGEERKRKPTENPYKGQSSPHTADLDLGGGLKDGWAHDEHGKPVKMDRKKA